MTEYRIKIYRAKNGRSYFQEWIDRLDKSVRYRIQARLFLLESGSFGDSKSVGDGVHELRFHFGSGYRVYIGVEGREIILLLTGSIKRDQDSAIALAKSLWKEYKDQKNAT